MMWLSFIALLPAFVLSESAVSGDITEIQVCQYFDARIVRFEEKVKEMKELVDVDSEFYRTLEASNLCDTVGRVAVPECVANHEGDECAAAKIESIKKPLLRAIKVDKSGKEFFDYCKYIGYKNVLKTFLKTRKLMAGECGLPGQKSSGDREGRNSLLLPLLVAGAYDPSSIWFQYFLCKDQQIYCYFFTQGWNQYEYGQYYLYENLLDDTTGIFAGSTDSNLATLALLGGLGGGSPGYYPSPSGYSQAPAALGRKRRGSGEDSCVDGVGDGCQSKRKRRSEERQEPDCKDGNCDRRRRQEPDCKDGDANCDRRRRQEPNCEDGDRNCDRRRRQEPDCKDGKCDRKRRQEPDCKDGDGNCDRRRRQEPDCEDGDRNCDRRRRQEPDCKDGKCDRKRRQEPDCKDGDANCDRRRRQEPNCEDGDGKCDRRRRQEPDCKDGKCDRKRRQEPDCEDGDGNCDRRRRQEPDCKDGKCDRKRRQEPDCKDGDGNCDRRRRQEPDCKDGKCDRKRRQACKDPDNKFCCENGIWKCV